MSNLMVYPAEIAEMTVNQLAALPHAKLLEATTNLDELLKWAKEIPQTRALHRKVWRPFHLQTPKKGNDP